MPFMARRYATTMSLPKVEQEQRYVNQYLPILFKAFILKGM